MKITRFLAPLFLLVATAFGQVTMYQLPGTYTDKGVARRSGTYNRYENTTVLITDTNGMLIPGSITNSALTSGRVPFASTSGLIVDSASLTFNSGTGALSATSFVGAVTGTATNATNVGITNDTTTNATMFPLWVTANTGNLPAKVTSTKLSFNPSTGILSSTGFTGTFNGNTFTAGTGVLTIAAGKTLTISNTLTATGTDGSSIAFGTGGTVMYNPMTTTGDIIVGGASGVPTRQAQGGNGTFWGVSGGVAGYYTPAGGGNVSNSGTPTSGQAAEWTSATVIQGVGVTGTVNYVKSTGPSLSNPTITNYEIYTAGTPTYAAGKLQYDSGNESLTFYNNDSNVGLQVGQESWIRVRNDTGSTIPNGAPVYISGAASGLPQISLANANSAATATLVGLTTEAITTGSIGYVTSEGIVHDFDTSAFTAGTRVYLGTTAGTLTSTIPSNPNLQVTVGTVVVSNASTGSLMVTPSAGRVAGTLAFTDVANVFTAPQTFTPAARTSGVTSYFTVNAPTDTGITAATEAIGVNFPTATRTWATTGTVALQRERFFAGPTYASAGASQTFTDAFNSYFTPPIAGTNAIFTRNHTIGIVDSTSAASSITGGLVVATTLGTTATSVGIGGGNVNAGGLITGGTITSTGLFTASSTSTFTGVATHNNAVVINGAAGSTALTITNTARTSGVLPYIKYTIPTDTAQTAATESPGIQGVTGTRTWATTGTVALQREIFFPGPTYASASASQTFTDVFNMYLTPPVAGTNAIFTRGHTLGIVDSTSAASSITGGLVVATALGTTATSVGIGGGNINAGGSITAGGALTATGAATLNGANTLATVARSSGAASYLTVTTPADTNQTLSTEVIGANFTAATRQWATGTLTTQRERVFAAPTYSFVGASTLTTAINVDIADPVAGTNATFTNGYALRSGKSLFTGEVTTAASTTSTAGFNLPHGTAPTSPVNGDVWTTTSGLSARINGATINYGSSSISGLTTTALVTANGSTAIQTPSATATMDSSGNISTPGTMTVGNAATTAGAVAFTQGTTASTGTTNVTIQAPASVTSYIITLPAAVGTNLGIWQQTVSGSVATIAPTVNPQITTVELGAATDTTLSRDSAGVIAVEGNIVSMVGARKTTITSSATPTFDIRTCDVVNITALATAITSMTSSMTITGVQDFQQLEFRILDNGTARAITWGANFAAGPTALPTTTTLGKALTVWFEYDAVQAKFMCMSAGSYP